MRFGSGVDSAFVTSYHLNVPFDETKILSNGYKGGNTRDGLIKNVEVIAVQDQTENGISIYPNPSTGILNIHSQKIIKDFYISVLDLNGKKVFEHSESSSKS